MNKPGKVFNHEAAHIFLQTVRDPIVKTLINNAYQTMCISEAAPEGEFDLLYFYRILEGFMRDREDLARALMGNFGENPTGWGE